MLGFFVPGAAEVIIIGLVLAVFVAIIAGAVALFHAVHNGTPSDLNRMGTQLALRNLSP